MEDFIIGLAGVSVRIRCRSPRNRLFLEDYITSGEPRFTVEPTQEDIERIRSDFARKDQEEGNGGFIRSETFLENNAIHAILAERMVAEGVLLIHGSALCMDGQAVIFTAASGTGKSTHTRLWREVFGSRVWMINDDKPMINTREMRVYGTPWDGKHHLSRNASAPLKAIVELKRSSTNRIAPMSKAGAVSLLMKHAYVSRDPVTMGKILTLEEHLLGAVECHVLYCNMDPEAARTACEGLHFSPGT